MNPKKLKRASVSVQKLRVVEAVTLSSFQSGKDFKFFEIKLVNQHFGFPTFIFNIPSHLLKKK